MDRLIPLLWAVLLLQLCVVPPVAADPSEARMHFDKATSAFALGKFADAATEYEKAFELKADADFSTMPRLVREAAPAPAGPGAGESCGRRARCR